jgi:hypothetical protein
MVKMKEFNGTMWLDEGFLGLSIAHEIKIHYFITLKVLKGDVFKVNILDYIMMEVVMRCPQHDPTLATIDE